MAGSSATSRSDSCTPNSGLACRCTRRRASSLACHPAPDRSASGQSYSIFLFSAWTVYTDLLRRVDSILGPFPNRTLVAHLIVTAGDLNATSGIVTLPFGVATAGAFGDAVDTADLD